MTHKILNRRTFLRGMGAAAAATLVAACQPKVVEKVVEKEVTKVVKEMVKETVVVKEAVEVEKEVTRVVEKVVEGKPAPAETITLRIQTRGGTAGEYGRHFAAQFDEEHPNITIKTEDTIYSELLTKQELGFISGTMQDVVYSGTKWYDYACYKGLYTALDGYINAKPYHFDDYYPAAIEACIFEGKIFGLPGDSHPHARELLLWNRPLLEQAGYSWPVSKEITMEEVKEIAMAGTRPDEGIFGTRFSTGNYYDYECVLLNPFGGHLLSSDGRKMMFMEDEKVVDATKWYLEMVKAHATPYRGDMLENQDMFYAGKMVSNNTGLSGLTGIDAATENGKLWEWDWTLVPLGPEGRGSQLFINQWCVGSTTEYPAAAYEFISYMTSAEVGIWATVNMHKQPNGSRTAWYSKEVAEVEPAFAACAPWFEQENLQRFPMPWNLRYAEFQDTWVNLTDALFFGEKSLDEVAPEVTQKCQEILDMPRP